MTANKRVAATARRVATQVAGLRLRLADLRRESAEHAGADLQMGAALREARRDAAGGPSHDIPPA